MAPPPTILICDDEADLREIFTFDLTEAGYKVIEATGGREAWQKLRSQTVQAIITDVRMPQGSGIELLRNVRAEISQDLPVIFLTGCSDTEAMSYFRLGVHSVLCKPFEVDSLFMELKRLLTPRAERWRTARSPLPKGALQILVANAQTDIRFGQGGFSLSLPRQNIGLGPVDFRIPLSDASLPELVGQGCVRWLRKTSETSDVEVGIEVFTLSDDHFEQALSFFEKAPHRNYLPD